jgi:hypothetical protein
MGKIYWLIKKWSKNKYFVLSINQLKKKMLKILVNYNWLIFSLT